jgi:hypothetical protein
VTIDKARRLLHLLGWSVGGAAFRRHRIIIVADRWYTDDSSLLGDGSNIERGVGDVDNDSEKRLNETNKRF